jgi:outer membrane protein W
LAKSLSLLLLFLAISTAPGLGQETEETGDVSVPNRHQIGIRMGTWINAGDDAPPLLLLLDENDAVVGQLETDLTDVSFYFEGYFAYNLFSQTFIELSFGIVNRGSVTIQDGPITDVGNLMLYPLLLQFKYYPLALPNSGFHPYLAVGGGLYHGRQDIQFTTDLFFTDLAEDTETDFNYVISGGADWILSDNVALDLNVKYMPINFSQSLVTIRDYDAVAVSVGIKYLYRNKK